MTEDALDDTFTVVFQPSGVRGKVEAGTSLRSAATLLGVEIESICADTATCGKCRVLIEDGRLGKIDSSPQHASPMGPTEELWFKKRANTWRKRGLDPERLRLSCQAEVLGDMVVFVPESSRGNRQIIRKSATDRAIEIRPAVRRYYVELESATLTNPRGDLERLSQALVEALDRVHPEPAFLAPSAEEMTIDFRALQRVANAIREGSWKVSVSVLHDREIIDVRPGYSEDLYGIAVDVGSTALAVHLCDLITGELIASESMMNPQTAYGDDIMSRMTYEAEHVGGLETLRDAVVIGLNSLITKVRRAAKVKSEDILELTIVGNTTMHHLLLGLTTKHLSRVPFVPTSHQPFDIKARDLNLDVNPSANVHLLPYRGQLRWCRCDGGCHRRRTTPPGREPAHH